MGRGGACVDCPPAEILIVFAITALINLDVSISVPSLWEYTQQLGGDRSTYGLAACGSFVSAVIMLPVFGYLGDRSVAQQVSARRPSSRIRACSNVVAPQPGAAAAAAAAAFLFLVIAFNLFVRM